MLYSTLNTNREEIRLLTLSPGKHDADIHACLSVVSLQNFPLPEFNALSYVWGDTVLRKPISLNGTVLTVTENLEAALRRIREEDEIRVVWVDAICVNQDDVKERNTQVLLMKKIYSQAVKVQVWLGEEEEGDTEAMVFLTLLSSGEHLFPKGCYEGHGLEESRVSNLAREEDKTDCWQVILLLNRFMSKPWWSRTWTLQEISLARDVEIVCGGFQVPWNDIKNVSHQRGNHWSSCCNARRLCTSCMTGLAKAGNLIGDIEVARAGNSATLYMPLLDTLGRNRFRNATDPRDKVFAMLSLVRPAIAEELLPDYEASVKKVYIEAAMKAIKWTASLQLFTYISKRGTPEYQLPSWVPDWSYQPPGNDYSSWRSDMYNQYKACSTYSLCWNVHEDEILDVDGIFISKIKSLGTTLSTATYKAVYETITEWRTVCELDKDFTAKYLLTKQPMKDVFWRTVLGDTMVTPQYASSNVTDSIYRARIGDGEAFWEYVEGLEQIHKGESVDVLLKEPKNVAMNAMVQFSASSRRLFTTESGGLGLGPQELEVGDEIWILGGGNVPVALRKDIDPALHAADREVWDGDEDEDPFLTRELVGLCYVHGIMDGEVGQVYEQLKRSVYIR